MKRAFVFRTLLTVFAALLVFGAACALLMQQQYLESKREEIKGIFRTLAVSGTTRDYGTLSKELTEDAADGLHITFLSPGGKILGGGSADPDAEDPLSRPEVGEAQKDGYGEGTRYSQSLKASQFYAAQKMPDGTIVWLAVSLKSLRDHLWRLLPALLAVLLASMAVVPPLVMRMSKGILQPLREIALSLQAVNAGGYGKDLSSPRFEEFAPIVSEINALSQKIAHTLSDLTVERGRINYLLNNMHEGMVVLDGSGRILILNRSAAAFFGAQGSLTGQDLLCLTRIPKITQAAQLALKEEKPSAFDFPSPAAANRILRVSVTPVAKEASGDQSGGVVLLITDVTAVRRSEQIRSEFFANASHELKTPLTSIKGFAELMETGIVDDPEQTKRYLALIRKETERMIGLISDILKLSELESRASETDRQSVSLLMTARKVAESLSLQAQEKQVEIHVEGDDGLLDANPDRMTQLVLNLLDNAVKYNVQGGKVNVFVRSENERVLLTVADTGVGIPPEAQERVFERFYRVDKSRSRRLGGTGLGLSIVKHIVGLYKGEIRLKSELGRGTEIRVSLPARAG